MSASTKQLHATPPAPTLALAEELHTIGVTELGRDPCFERLAPEQKRAWLAVARHVLATRPKPTA